jgi:hypothetical protein
MRYQIEKPMTVPVVMLLAMKVQPVGPDPPEPTLLDMTANNKSPVVTPDGTVMDAEVTALELSEDVV